MAKAIMIQGSGSNVGKSLLVAGLCRVAARRGLRVRPFKPQNMSNNAAVSADGGEVGRATALQARACGVAAHSDMNPILLKPESDSGAQLIVQGRKQGRAMARDYKDLKPKLLAAVMQSFTRLSSESDLIIVEGAGSAGETNLRASDIANMGFAESADIAVVLLGDIDRGGVIAQMVGTHAVLDASDRARIVGFIINKFRGDMSVFADGLADITRHTGWSFFGVLPWFESASLLPPEDSVDLARLPKNEKSQDSNSQKDLYRIVVPHLPRIANFDDLDALRAEPQVRVEMIAAGHPLPQGADLILIPGSKSTLSDLAFLRAQGWDIDIAAHLRGGGRVLGICGGYQMLGKTISDKDGVEGRAGTFEGLGHLDMITEMTAQKNLANVRGKSPLYNAPIRGYEIHIGQSHGPDCKNSWLEIKSPDGSRKEGTRESFRKEGAMSADGRVMGCYIHGLFADDKFRAAFLKADGGVSKLSNFEANIERVLDSLADHIETHLDTEKLFAQAR